MWQTAFREEVQVYVSSQSSQRRRSLVPGLSRFSGGGREDDDNANGKWVRCQVELSGSTLRMQASQRRDQYSGKLILTKSTRCFRLEFEGRAHCLALYGFKGAQGRTKRYFDLGTAERVESWSQTMAAFVGAVDDGKCLPRSRTRLPTTNRSRSPSNSPSHRLERGNSHTLAFSRIRPPSADFSSVEKRWTRALEYARTEVRRKRLRETGFSAKELVQIMIRVRTLAARHTLHIKFKVRRMLTLLARAYAKKRRAVLAWNTARSRRFERMLSSRNSLSRRSHHYMIQDEERRHEIPISSGGHHFLHNIIDTRITSTYSEHTRQILPLDRSAFQADYAYLLKRERLWPMLVRTLHDGHHRARTDRDPGHALRCLMAIRVARMVIGTRGGLAACLDAGLEQRSLEYFFAAGLYSKIPVLVSSVLDMLTGLVQVPGRGAATVRRVLEFIDRITKWDKPLCSKMPLLRSPQARESRRHLVPTGRQSSKPPPYAALAVLLNDSPEHDCCVDLKPNVVALMAAVCHAEPTPAAAQWQRARIFHACRAVLMISNHPDGRPMTPRGGDGSTAMGTFSSRNSRSEIVERLSTSSKLSERHSAAKRAKRRRSVIGLRRGSLTKDKPSIEALFKAIGDGDCDLSSSEDDSDDSEEERGGSASLRLSIDGGSGGSGGDRSYYNDDDFTQSEKAKLIHPCPPLAALARRRPQSDSTGRDEVDWHFLRLQLERFLDAWDLHELNEVEEGLNLAPASSERYEMYFERIRRSALLLGPVERLDSLLAALGLDFEHAAALPGFMAARERQHLQERGSLVLDADFSWRALKGIDRNLTQLFAAKPLTLGDRVMADETPIDHLNLSLTYLHAGDSLKSSSKAKSNTSSAVVSAVDAATAAVVEDPRLGKYKKMLAMHIPAVAVALKMRAEGMDPSTLGLAVGESTEANSKDKLNRSVASSDDPELFLPVPQEKPHGCSRWPGVKTRRVFLDAVPATHTKGTWWHSVDEDETLQDEALSELERLFLSVPGKNLNDTFGESSEAKAAAAQEASVAEKEESQQEAKRSLVSEAIGERRAFALSLSWGSLRMDPEDVVKAVATLDPDGTALLSTVQRLSTLHVLLSSAADLEAIETKVHEAEDVDESTLDEVSKAFKGLVQAAKRPRAKVRLLYLYATVNERSNEVLSAIHDYQGAVLNVRGSGALRKIMGCVLAVSNFVNHGSQRGMARGVRVAALAQLRSTRMTKNEPYKNMLQFVAEYAGVSPQLLEEELKPKLLRRVADGMERSAIQSEIEQLHEERDAASQEHALLASECDAQSGASSEDALRVAFTAIAATRAAQIVADIDAQLEHLEREYDAMDDDVNALLQTFGEAVVITASDNATKWFSDLVTFVTHYTEEHAELREAAARRTKREQLVQKASARDVLLESGTVAARRRRSGLTCENASESLVSPALSSAQQMTSASGRSSSSIFVSTPSPSTGDKHEKAHHFNSDSSPQQLPLTDSRRRISGSKIPYDLPPPEDNHQFHSKPTPRNGTICVDCKLNDRASCPGAYAKSDGLWYCGDCWHRLSLVDTNWRNDFGDETYPVDDPGDSAECPTDAWLNNDRISGSNDDSFYDDRQTESEALGTDSLPPSTRTRQLSTTSVGSTESDNKSNSEDSRYARRQATLNALRLPSLLRGVNETDRASSSANSAPASPTSSKSRSPKGQHNRAGRLGRNLLDLAKSAIRKKSDTEQLPSKSEGIGSKDDLDGMSPFMRVATTMADNAQEPDDPQSSIDVELEFRRKQIEAARKRRAQQVTNNAVANGESSLLAFWTSSGVVDHSQTARREPRRPATTTHAGLAPSDKAFPFRQISRPATSTHASQAADSTQISEDRLGDDNQQRNTTLQPEDFEEHKEEPPSLLRKKRASYTVSSTERSLIPAVLEAKSPLYDSSSVFVDAAALSRNSSESGGSPIILSRKELRKLNMSRQNMSVEDPEFYLQPASDHFVQITSASGNSSPCNSLTDLDSRNSAVDLESRSSSACLDEVEMSRSRQSAGTNSEQYNEDSDSSVNDNAQQRMFDYNDALTIEDSNEDLPEVVSLITKGVDVAQKDERPSSYDDGPAESTLESISNATEAAILYTRTSFDENGTISELDEEEDSESTGEPLSDATMLNEKVIPVKSVDDVHYENAMAAYPDSIRRKSARIHKGITLNSEQDDEDKSSVADSVEYDPWSTAVVSTATTEKKDIRNDEAGLDYASAGRYTFEAAASTATENKSDGDAAFGADEDPESSDAARTSFDNLAASAKIGESHAASGVTFFHCDIPPPEAPDEFSLKECTESALVVALIKSSLIETPPIPLACWFSMSPDCATEDSEKVEYFLPPASPLEISIKEPSTTSQLPLGLSKDVFLLEASAHPGSRSSTNNAITSPASPVYPPMSPASQILERALADGSELAPRPSKDRTSPVSSTFSEIADEDAPASLSRPSLLSLSSRDDGPKPTVSTTAPLVYSDDEYQYATESADTILNEKAAPSVWSRSVSMDIPDSAIDLDEPTDDVEASDQTTTDIPAAWLTLMGDDIESDPNADSSKNEETNKTIAGSTLGFFTQYMS